MSMVDRVLREAQRFNNKSRSMADYEQYKSKLVAVSLSSKEYEDGVKKLAKIIGV